MAPAGGMWDLMAKHAQLWAIKDVYFETIGNIQGRNVADGWIEATHFMPHW